MKVTPVGQDTSMYVESLTRGDGSDVLVQATDHLSRSVAFTVSHKVAQDYLYIGKRLSVTVKW